MGGLVTTRARRLAPTARRVAAPVSRSAQNTVCTVRSSTDNNARTESHRGRLDAWNLCPRPLSPGVLDSRLHPPEQFCGAAGYTILSQGIALTTEKRRAAFDAQTRCF